MMNYEFQSMPFSPNDWFSEGRINENCNWSFLAVAGDDIVRASESNSSVKSAICSIDWTKSVLGLPEFAWWRDRW